MTIKLSKLEKVDLRKVWKKEDKDFTPWLARERNIQLLADTIGMDLEMEEEEKSVGPYYADILCKNLQDDSPIVIENQLEATDHKHLGQLLTYASGLDAFTLIWIAKAFTEEHKAALNRLNEITNEDFRFFGLEIELWRIGESAPAPKFNIVSEPNNWKKETKNKGRHTEMDIFRKEYWEVFSSHLKKENFPLKLQNPGPYSSHRFSIGRSGFWIATLMQTREERIGVELCVTQPKGTKAFFNLLHKDKEQIEKDIGDSLRWHKDPENRVSKIQIWKESDPNNKNDWDKQHKWLKEKIELFNKAFSKRVKKLNPEDWEELEEESLDEE